MIRRRLLPCGIAAQIVLLVVLSAVIFHICITAALVIGHIYFRPSRPAFDGHLAWESRHLGHNVERDLNVAAVAGALQFAESPPPGFGDRPPPPRDFGDGPPPQQGFADRPPPPPHDRPPPLHVRLVPAGPDVVPMIIATLIFIAISFTIFLIWAAFAVTRPLRKFAQAVDSFSAEGPIAKLEEKGPQELAAAAQALNRMRERVALMIAQRTQMLAAIGHDLRTPVTRLRLRAEFVEPPDLRDSMLRDLEQMNTMIHSALSFIREGIEAQRNTLLDLGALLQTIRDEFVDMGHNVRFEPPAPTFVRGSAEELYRALTNLVSNGVKFGTSVEIALRQAEADRVEIDILDDGPGIPADSRDAMFAPFTRGDSARKSEPLQGFGLGLPISRAIVAAHRGSLELLERSPHGVIARVTLTGELAA